jgi:hypothetical protein
MRRNHSIIWEIQKDNGEKASSFKEIENDRVKYFKGLFKESHRDNVIMVVAAK